MDVVMMLVLPGRWVFFRRSRPAVCVLPSRYVSITVKFGTFAESKILHQCSGFSWEFVLSNG